MPKGGSLFAFIIRSAMRPRRVRDQIRREVERFCDSHWYTRLPDGGEACRELQG
jgi:hypothetical protein